MYSFVFCHVFSVLVDFRLHCVTTVTPFIKDEVKAGHCDLAGILDDSHQKLFYFAEIRIRCNFFSSSPRRKPPLPLCAIGSKKGSFFFPSKSNRLCRTLGPIWLSSQACDRLCAYQLMYCIEKKVQIYRYLAFADLSIFKILIQRLF